MENDGFKALVTIAIMVSIIVIPFALFLIGYWVDQAKEFLQKVKYARKSDLEKKIDELINDPTVTKETDRVVTSALLLRYQSLSRARKKATIDRLLEFQKLIDYMGIKFKEEFCDDDNIQLFIERIRKR